MVTIPEREPFIQPLDAAWHQPYVAKMAMLRLDVVHPVVSGNKWYKLKHNINHAIESGYSSVLTFGGGYSNHLIATAATAKASGIKAIGIVRGIYDELTPTLKDCVSYGMQLGFVTKEVYANKQDGTWLQQLSNEYGQPYIIPEGGANEWGREGAEEIAAYIPDTYTHICVSAGTGTTLAGLRNALPAEKQVWSYVPMKNGKYLAGEIVKYLHADKNTNWQLFDNWHFSGFGKWNDELIHFMNEFYQMNHIPLDIVYTGKMMYGIKDQLSSHVFPDDASVLCIHTGGLQGNISVRDKLTY